MAPKHRRGALKRSRVGKRSLRIDGSNTSVTLEDAFWNALREVAAARNIRVSELISTIKIEPQRGSNLSSAIRPFVLDYYQRKV
jgi:predicted DNA-binding ribbon-helix-helix protein